jgi:hypothetical protein
VKSDIETFETDAGWIGTGSVVVQGTNAAPELIADNKSASLVFYFPAGSQGESITLTLGTPFDISGYTNVVFHLWSRERQRERYAKSTDCSYKLGMGGQEYFIRTFGSFAAETIGVEDLTTITDLTFTCLHDEEDYLVVSAMVAELPEVPLDIFTAVGDELDRLFALEYGNGLQIATLDLAAGATLLPITGSSWISRYSVVRITDGVNTETHQLDEEGTDGFTLAQTFDGTSILHDYTGAGVYLLFPARAGIGSSEIEINIPGFSIWGMNPTPVQRSNDLDQRLDTFQATTTGVTPEGRLMTFPILVDAEAHGYELLAYMSRLVRKWLDTHQLWINGRAYDVDWEEAAVEIEPTESFDVLPKIQYTIYIEIKEELWPRTKKSLAQSASLTLNPSPVN